MKRFNINKFCLDEKYLRNNRIYKKRFSMCVKMRKYIYGEVPVVKLILLTTHT